MCCKYYSVQVCEVPDLEAVYADSLLTERRPDVCEELFAQINEKLSANDIALDEAKLVALNPYISRITTFSKDT